MKPTFYPVHMALTSYVKYIMITDVTLPGNMGSYIPFPPVPQNTINFYPGDAAHSRKPGGEFFKLHDAVIVGPQTTRIDLAMGVNHRFLSVVFHPGGMYRLLKIPMYHLMDVPFNAADILGNDVYYVNEQLKNTFGHQQMKDVVEGYLLRKIKHAHLSPLYRSLTAMLAPGGTFTIDDAASLSCLSNRQFERRVKEAVGYSPKFFARLIRFSKAYRMKVDQQKTRWSNIAYACGYFDQAHMVKDFKEFTATNPVLLAKEISQSPLQVQGNLKL